MKKILIMIFLDHIRFSTECLLICGTEIIRGTLAITHNAMFLIRMNMMKILKILIQK